MKTPYYNNEERMLIRLGTQIGAFLNFRLAVLHLIKTIKLAIEYEKILKQSNKLITSICLYLQNNKRNTLN